MRFWIGSLAFALYGQSERGAWTTYGGNHAGWRYSESTQINGSNVATAAAGMDFSKRRCRANSKTTPLVPAG